MNLILLENIINLNENDKKDVSCINIFFKVKIEKNILKLSIQTKCVVRLVYLI